MANRRAVNAKQKAQNRIHHRHDRELLLGVLGSRT